VTQIDPAAIVPAADPLAGFSPDQIAALTALLGARGAAVNTVEQAPTAAPDTDAPAAVESSPAPGASVPAPVSSVPAPPVTSIVHQLFTPPGAEHGSERFGIVVAVDDSQNVASVVWFLTEPTTVAGDTITQVV
jgi:hypothetical protein